jgi:SpoVK/Ycf46/Vps4 family AAA+-type ATPase
VRQAAIWSVKEILLDPQAERVVQVKMEHFNLAFGSVRPSVSDQDRRRYEHLRTVFDIVK